MRPDLKRPLLVTAIVLAVHLALWIPSPGLAAQSLRNWGQGLVDVLLIVPSVLVLIGLFDAWVPKEVVAHNLGRTSGVRLALTLPGIIACGFLMEALLSRSTSGPRTATGD